MPADLSHGKPRSAMDPLERAVLNVLAGGHAPYVAAAAGIDLARLTGAVAAYASAGRAVLAREQRDDWLQFNLELNSYTGAEDAFVRHVAPTLAEQGANWWFMRKSPVWRLRVAQTLDGEASRLALTTLLNQLVNNGILANWWTSIYEPETHAFGGTPTMVAAHELFAADSNAIINALGSRQGLAARRGLSVLLCTQLMRMAGLDWFEQGDAWSRVLRHRDTGAPDSPTAPGQVRRLLLSDTRAIFSQGGALHQHYDWWAAFDSAGRQLARADRAGTTTRGLRAIVANHVLFHWNRIGLTTHDQERLARAAVAATTPGEP